MEHRFGWLGCPLGVTGACGICSYLTVCRFSWVLCCPDAVGAGCAWVVSVVSVGLLLSHPVVCIRFGLNCVCLTTTRPSGHISRPSQVGFSHSYLCSINENLWWCTVVGINSTLECSHLVTHLNKELCWIYGLSYQIKEPSFSQQPYYASLGDCLKEGPQWVNCVVLITTLLQHCTFQEYVFNGQSLTTMLASSRLSSGQDMGFCGLRMAKLESSYHNLLSSG